MLVRVMLNVLFEIRYSVLDCVCVCVFISEDFTSVAL